MSGYDAIDLFAGPGGWDTAAAILGVRTVGIETNALACATARAAGHVRVQHSVAELDPARLRRCGRGLIGSPPCPPFSKAGKRLGMKDQPRLFAHADEVQARGNWVDPGADGWHDEDSPLTLEPLRWALALGPDWIALEQVPDVLPYWEQLADVFRSFDYRAWCGVLDSEMYGVPQTRDRAILIASLRSGHNVSRPPATHHRFVPGRTSAVDLFDDLLPWVSMADALGWGFTDEALGWGFTDEPACTVSSGGAETGGAEPFANANYRRRLAMHVNRSEAFLADNPRRDHPVEEPAPTITSKARSHTWVYTNNDSRTAGGGKERFHRSTQAPSPSITGSTGSWSVRMCAAGATSPETAGTRPRTPDEPSATLIGKGTAAWVRDAPATTVQGDPRIAPRGHHERQFNGETVRVSVEEAACLQSFPAGYPWNGGPKNSRTAQYQQIGNAVPVLLAVAVLGHLLDINGWRDICRDAYAPTEQAA